MSKAFTKETDDAPEQPLARRRELDLPPGTKNYVTPAGARALREELDSLLRLAHPDAATLARLQELGEQLESAEIVDPATQDQARVLFGATVTLADDDDQRSTYRIVGIAEADPRQGTLSWRSPVAAALLGARVGDVVTLRLPRGPQERTVVAISYAL